MRKLSDWELKQISCKLRYGVSVNEIRKKYHLQITEVAKLKEDLGIERRFDSQSQHAFNGFYETGLEPEVTVKPRYKF